MPLKLVGSPAPGEEASDDHGESGATASALDRPQQATSVDDDHDPGTCEVEDLRESPDAIPRCRIWE